MVLISLIPKIIHEPMYKKMENDTINIMYKNLFKKFAE